MRLTKVRHLWPEPAGFEFPRPNGAKEWIFIHFLSPVTVWCGEEEWEVPAGGAIMLGRETPNNFHSEGPLVHNWMHLDGDDTVELWKSFGLPVDKPFYPHCDSLITQTMRELEKEFFAYRYAWNDETQALCDALVMRLFIHLARGLRQTSTAMSPELEERFRALHREMHTNLEKHWTVAEMADRVFLSVSHFHTLYRQLFGISPMRDLVVCRVEQAKDLLGTYTVAQTAAMLGYASPCHFIHQFKQITGVSPGKLRK